MGRTLSRPLRVYGRPISKSSAIFLKSIDGISYFPYMVALSGRDKVRPPHLTRETLSGRRPADGADTPGGVFRSGENLPGEAVQPDIILSGSALRKQNHSISFSIQRCQTPGTKDSYTHPTTPSAGRSGGVLTCLTKSLPFLCIAERAGYRCAAHCRKIRSVSSYI